MCIQRINLTGNKIHDFNFVDALTMCHQLKTLDLSRNLICQAENYRHIIIALLPNLSLLDNVKCTDGNTSGASNNNHNNNRRNTHRKSLSMHGSETADTAGNGSPTPLTYGMIAEANGSLSLMNEALEDEAHLESGLFGPRMDTVVFDVTAANSNHYDNGKH